MVTVQPLVGTSVTITETFSVDGAPTDLDTGVPTIAAFYPDGTAVTPAPTASGTWTGRTTGQYRIVLPGEVECTILDPITWTGTIGGEQQTLYSRVEWVGNHLFTIAGLRALKVAGDSTPKFASSAAWPDARLQAARSMVLDEFTKILGFSPVPRFSRETVDGTGTGCVLVGAGILPSPRLLRVTINGTVQTPGLFTLKPTGELRAVSNYLYSGILTVGADNITAEYVAGWPAVLGDGPSVAMVVAAAQLDPSVFASATNVSTPDGGSYSFDPAGQVTRAGMIRHYGIPKVDAWLNRHAQPMVGIA